jgi:hypothetical protein
MLAKSRRSGIVHSAKVTRQPAIAGLTVISAMAQSRIFPGAIVDITGLDAISTINRE